MKRWSPFFAWRGDCICQSWGGGGSDRIDSQNFTVHVNCQSPIIDREGASWELCSPTTSLWSKGLQIVLLTNLRYNIYEMNLPIIGPTSTPISLSLAASSASVILSISMSSSADGFLLSFFEDPRFGVRSFFWKGKSVVQQTGRIKIQYGSPYDSWNQWWKIIASCNQQTWTKGLTCALHVLQTTRTTEMNFCRYFGLPVLNNNLVFYYLWQ